MLKAQAYLFTDSVKKFKDKKGRYQFVLQQMCLIKCINGIKRRNQ